MAALAVADALGAASGTAASLSLKWPNDVLLGGAKVSGILAELCDLMAGGRAAAIGIGVNLAAAPDLPGVVALSSVIPSPPTPETFRHLLTDAFVRYWRAWEAEGFDAIRSAWLARAAGLGAPMLARLGQTERRGVFAGLAPDGALLLDTGDGIETITAADVYFDPSTRTHSA